MEITSLFTAGKLIGALIYFTQIRAAQPGPPFSSRYSVHGLLLYDLWVQLGCSKQLPQGKRLRKRKIMYLVLGKAKRTFHPQITLELVRAILWASSRSFRNLHCKPHQKNSSITRELATGWYSNKRGFQGRAGKTVKCFSIWTIFFLPMPVLPEIFLSS